MKTIKKTISLRKILFILTLTTFTLSTSTQAAETIGFDLSNLSGSLRVTPPEQAEPTEVPGFLRVSAITRGQGIDPSPLAGSFSANAWNDINPSRESAIADNEFFEFSITNPSGAVSFQSLNCRLRVSSSRAAFTAEWQYSMDGFATEGRPFAVYPRGTIPVGGDGDAMPTIDLSRVRDLQNVPAGTVITFRLYAWGADAPTNSFAIGRSRPPVTEGGEPIGNSLEIRLIRD